MKAFISFCCALMIFNFAQAQEFSVGESCNLERDENGAVTKVGAINAAGACEELGQNTGASNAPDLKQTQKDDELKRQAAVTACQNAAKEAQESCATDKDGDVDVAFKTVDRLAAQVSIYAKGTGSMAMACSSLSKMADAANAGLVAFKARCAYKAYSCNTACEASSATGTTDYHSLNICKNAFNTVQGVETQIMSLASYMMDAKKCSQKTPQELFCEKNPTASACKNYAASDCSRAENANQPLCKCQANPNLPECGLVLSKVNIPTGSAAGGVGDTGSANDKDMIKQKAAAMAKAAADMKNMFGNIKNAAKGSGTDSGTPAPGGAKPVSASTGNGNGGGARGKMSNPADTTVNKGFYGSTGSSGGGGGGYGGPGPGGTYAAAGPQGPDLRKYLPANPSLRRTAGETGPDGITGPTDDIFSKINNGYRRSPLSSERLQ